MTSQGSILPQYIGIVQDTSLDFYNKSTNLLNTLGNYLTEINENIKFSKALVTTNVLSSYSILFNELEATNFTLPNYTVNNGNVTLNGVKILDNSFKQYFIEKYLSLSDEYKTVVNKGIQNGSYFAPFSDDIGYTTNPVFVLDNSTTPYFDVFNASNLIPLYIPTTLYNKTSLNEKVILKTFSYYADPLLKQNLKGLQSGTLNNNTAQLSHGTNLINDVLYYQRATNNYHDFLVVLQTTLDKIANFIIFFEGLNPKDQDPARSAFQFNYTITNLEQAQLAVDVLKNNLQQVILSTQAVLGSA
jgi:hypothetical protein